MSERSECVEILHKIFEQKVFYSTLKPYITEKNVSFCNMLVLSVLRHLTGLENIIAKFVLKKIPQKSIILKYILFAAIAEIMLLKTPDYAVINEYVNIAKKKTDKFSANMVNAVLRKIVSQKTELNIYATFPQEFYKILKEDYMQSEIENIEESCFCEAPLDLNVKENHTYWAQQLNGTLFSNGTIRIFDAKSKISELKGYEEGVWWVQDLAASLPVMLLGNMKDKKVLDLCAAPGGKTAQLLAQGAKVTAVDIDFSRMEKLKQNMMRLKLEKNLETKVSEGLSFLQNNDNVFDVIVLDVPCSATGTFRKHPEVLHFKTIQDVKKQSVLQYDMLKTAIDTVKHGGMILYCTCSISKIEGEKIIQKIMQEKNNIELVVPDINQINVLNGKNLPKEIIDNGVLRTLPYYVDSLGGMDCFFAACIKKK